MTAPRIKGLDGSTFRFVRVDATGAIATTGGGAGADAARDNSGVVAFRVVSAVASRPLQFEGRNTSVNDRFWMLFNAAALPANGTVPDLVPYRVPAGSNFSIVLEPSLYATGITWAWSTTLLTLTVAGADGWVTSYHRP